MVMPGMDKRKTQTETHEPISINVKMPTDQPTIQPTSPENAQGNPGYIQTKPTQTVEKKT